MSRDEVAGGGQSSDPEHSWERHRKGNRKGRRADLSNFSVGREAEIPFFSPLFFSFLSSFLSLSFFLFGFFFRFFLFSLSLFTSERRV